MKHYSNPSRLKHSCPLPYIRKRKMLYTKPGVCSLSGKSTRSWKERPSSRYNVFVFLVFVPCLLFPHIFFFSPFFLPVCFLALLLVFIIFYLVFLATLVFFLFLHFHTFLFLLFGIFLFSPSQHFRLFILPFFPLTAACHLYSPLRIEPVPTTHLNRSLVTGCPP